MLPNNEVTHVIMHNYYWMSRFRAKVYTASELKVDHCLTAGN